MNCSASGMGPSQRKQEQSSNLRKIYSRKQVCCVLGQVSAARERNESLNRRDSLIEMIRAVGPAYICTSKSRGARHWEVSASRKAKACLVPQSDNQPTRKTLARHYHSASTVRIPWVLVHSPRGYLTCFRRSIGGSSTQTKNASSRLMCKLIAAEIKHSKVG